LLLDKCKALKKNRPLEPGINKKVLPLVEEVLADWSYDTVLKLTLATWHFDPWPFDAPPSSASTDLVSFLRRPNKDVIELLPDRYRTMMSGTDTLDDTFDFLLFLI
jgi:hypothetical protein